MRQRKCRSVCERRELSVRLETELRGRALGEQPFLVGVLSADGNVARANVGQEQAHQLTVSTENCTGELCVLILEQLGDRAIGRQALRRLNRQPETCGEG